MPRGVQGSATSRPSGGGRRPWFGRNSVGAGYHPQTWQGWAILVAAVAVIVVVVVLVRTGTL